MKLIIVFLFFFILYLTLKILFSPEKFQSNFIIHRRLSNGDLPPSKPLTSANLQDSSTSEELNTVENESGASWDYVVRVMVSYDMG